MTILIEDIDELADELVGVLLARLAVEPDPVVRWRAAARFGQRLGWVRALAVRQLLAEQPPSAVARMLGVTTARVSQLAHAAPEPGPAHAWGQALAVAGHLADLADHKSPSRRFRTEHAQLAAVALSRPAERAHLDHAVRRWAAAARRHRRGAAADEYLVVLDRLLAQTTGLPDQLTVDQLGDAVLGHHQRQSGQP